MSEFDDFTQVLATGGKVRYDEFGLESVLRSHNPFIKNRSDVMVVWMHYCMLRNLYKTYGGEGSVTEEKTEHLPRGLGWNGERNIYLLKYEFKNMSFALGIFIRDNEADCSLVTLSRSLRIGIPVNSLVLPDLTMNDRVCDKFTEVVEVNFIIPMTQKTFLKGFDTLESDGEDTFKEFGDLNDAGEGLTTWR